MSGRYPRLRALLAAILRAIFEPQRRWPKRW